MKGISITEQVPENSNVFCIKDNWEIIRGRMTGNVGCQSIGGVSHRTVHIAGVKHFGTVIADNEQNYKHLVGLFGSERVQKLDLANDTATKHLKDKTGAIGKVSNISCADARNSDRYFVVGLCADDTSFWADRNTWEYCVIYGSDLQEIKSAPRRPELKAGDYVQGVSDDLNNISDDRYIVVDNGEELVVFDDNDLMLPISEQLDLGYFRRL